MTALKQYAKLESQGVWRAHPDAQRQNVIVAFGDASLVIVASNGQPLSHWSLAAVVRVNPGDLPALYTPSADAIETLEVDDDMMIDAIEQVRTAILRSRPRHGRLRVILTAGVAAATVAAAVLWLPGALMRHTLGVVPEPTRSELGTRLFTAIGRVSGAPCRSREGDLALARLSSRLLAPGSAGLLVMPGGIPDTISLPGGAMLLNSRLVEDNESAEAVAGFVLAEDVRRHQEDPLRPLLESAGPAATIRLLTTGHMPDSALRAYAETLTTAEPARPPDAALLQRFEAAQVPSTPYAYALDITGEETLGLIEADPMRSGDARLVIGKADWAALQQICDG
ncbi:hypothetical protein [Tropicimonas isoalkanivorans]|uniref:Uncharacterized protein n=1 Tax=Tropicimonas isoalkanivorans TaxID=441112 RepID=A0A1I1QV93_9RHOB|nr:hypothetical protein [Tropicimonas isoalkanivorans]SFD23798.1 hypothetical protein SAMN04488094_12220 [Tropicimonas isoalkanivorans]